MSTTSDEEMIRRIITDSDAEADAMDVIGVATHTVDPSQICGVIDRQAFEQQMLTIEGAVMNADGSITWPAGNGSGQTVMPIIDATGE